MNDTIPGHGEHGREVTVFVVGIVSLSLNEASGLMLAHGADYIVEAVEEFEQLRRSSPK